MSRTKRKPYRGPRAVAGSCRSHGGCPYCLGNRQHATAKQKAKADASRDEQR